jgi:hypothetical protein
MYFEVIAKYVEVYQCIPVYGMQVDMDVFVGVEEP